MYSSLNCKMVYDLNRTFNCDHKCTVYILYIRLFLQTHTLTYSIFTEHTVCKRLVLLKLIFVQAQPFLFIMEISVIIAAFVWTNDFRLTAFLKKCVQKAKICFMFFFVQKVKYTLMFFFNCLFKNRNIL